jgi:hypothetical protein
MDIETEAAQSLSLPESYRRQIVVDTINRENKAMISSAVFEMYTGVAPTATLDEMLAALTETHSKSEKAEIGECLLCHTMQKRFKWENTDTARNHPTIKYSAITRNVQRGAVLTQCHEDTLTEIYPSLQATSGERAVKLNAECVRIMDPAAVTDYVKWAVAADVVATKMQSTPENHAALVEMLKTKDIYHPVQIRNALPQLAAGLGVAMPKRDAAAGNAGDKKADTVPTMTKVSEALSAWTDDRVAGVDDEHPFAMTPEEVDTAIKLVARVVRQLLAAGESAAVEQITADIAEASADAAADAATPKEPLAKVTRRINRDKFADA